MTATEAAKPPAILAAIVEITAALSREGISKDRRNEQQRYAFRGIEDVYGALSPLLAKNHVAILPRVTQRVETVREAKSGGSIYSVSVEVLYTLQSAVDGSSVQVAMWGEAMDSADKATNKAISAAYKYMAFTTFCIPVEGQDDADAETPPPSRPQTRRAEAPRNGLEPKSEPAKKQQPAVEPFAFAEEAIAAIQRCQNADELRAVGHRVAESKFQGDDVIAVREAWGEMNAQLKSGAAPR